MSQVLINQYLAKLDRTKKIGGSDRAGSVRWAFERLLEDWGEPQGLNWLNLACNDFDELLALVDRPGKGRSVFTLMAKCISMQVRAHEREQVGKGPLVGYRKGIT